MSEERVQKLLARAGLGSRRGCEEFIRAGRVRVNGHLIELGARANPAEDVITLDGEHIKISQGFTYVMLHKPQGVVSTVVAQAQEHRPTVIDLVNLPGKRLFPVGRLDVESEGLILLTDDGELANRLTHPRYGHTKTYRVSVARQPSDETLAAWRRGVVLADGSKTLPCQVSVTQIEKNKTWLKIVMHEGRKRQIREVGLALGHPASRIIRTHIGMLALGDLALSKWRELTSKEVKALTAIKKEKPRGKRRKGKKDRTSRTSKTSK